MGPRIGIAIAFALCACDVLAEAESARAQPTEKFKYVYHQCNLDIEHELVNTSCMVGVAKEYDGSVEQWGAGALASFVNTLIRSIASNDEATFMALCSGDKKGKLIGACLLQGMRSDKKADWAAAEFQGIFVVGTQHVLGLRCRDGHGVQENAYFPITPGIPLLLLPGEMMENWYQGSFAPMYQGEFLDEEEATKYSGIKIPVSIAGPGAPIIVCLNSIMLVGTQNDECCSRAADLSIAISRAWEAIPYRTQSSEWDVGLLSTYYSRESADRLLRYASENKIGRSFRREPTIVVDADPIYLIYNYGSNMFKHSLCFLDTVKSDGPDFKGVNWSNYDSCSALFQSGAFLDALNELLLPRLEAMKVKRN